MSTASVPTPLLTAEEFAERPDPGNPEELVRGRIVLMPMPKPRHGQICGRAYFLFRVHVDAQDLGHLLSNDSGVITERGPDTVAVLTSPSIALPAFPRGRCPIAIWTSRPTWLSRSSHRATAGRRCCARWRSISMPG